VGDMLRAEPSPVGLGLESQHMIKAMFEYLAGKNARRSVHPISIRVHGLVQRAAFHAWYPTRSHG